MAAQDQKVEFLFAAQVSGQEQLKKLTDAVDSLRKEMEALKAANGGVGAAMTGFSRSVGNASAHVQAYQKHLDAQAKAMRNHRQGTQQLGMQFNDLGTSISTGASPIQAFNQQLGQMGYALSMMEGRAGKVGAFLAGPWGAAIVLASMAVGFLIESLLGTDDASKKAKNATIDLADSFDFASASSEMLAKLNEALADANKEVAATAIQAANATAKKAAADATAAQEALNLANAELTKRKAVLTALKTPTAFAGGGVAGAALTAGQFATNRQNQAIDEQLGKVTGLEKAIGSLQMRNRKFTAESYSLSAAMDAGGKVTEQYQQAVNNLQNDFASNKITLKEMQQGIDAATSSYNKMKESMKTPRKGRTGKTDEERELERQQKETIKNLEDFQTAFVRATQKEMPEYQRSILALEEAFSKLNDAQKKVVASDFAKAFDELFAKRGEANATELGKAADDSVKSLISSIPDLAKVSPEMDAILKRADEMDKSFENIGTTISNSFKGILTGAMSFKDAMKSIISSVIDELFRLFVVQQIVGIVSGALGGLKPGGASGGAFGSSTGNFLPGIPANAYGGSVMGNKPTLVGERGPELFVPGGNGTIIPNSNMRGGGGGSNISVNVDARGSNDPAAVRAQVQQGILEAAPAIIAAAQARTVSGLRRPRLGGVMQ